jgi:hypothetical protein
MSPSASEWKLSGFISGILTWFERANERKCEEISIGYEPVKILFHPVTSLHKLILPDVGGQSAVLTNRL